MFKNLTKFAAVLVVMSVLLTAVGCGQKTASSNTGAEPAKKETKLDQVKKAGKIVVGTSADYPPYEFHKQVDGKDQIIGFDISIAREIAKDLGVQLEIKDMDFKGLLAALDAGNIDFIVAGMTPTEERKKNADFTKIYYTAYQSVVVRAEDKDKIKLVDDLKGKKVGAQKGSIQADLAKEQIKGAEIKELGKVSDLMLELKNKKVDALVVESPVAVAYINKNKDLTLSNIQIQIKPDEAGSAIALKKGNTELVEAMNKTLDRIVKDKLLDKFVKEASDASMDNN